MRILYHLSHYISHRESGLAFIECLRSLGHEVETEYSFAHQAEAAILHDDPMVLPELFEAHPQLQHLRTIAYSVWETECLPREYRDRLRLVDEIWTCSQFTATALREHFPQTAVVPHVVKRRVIAPPLLQAAYERVNGRDGVFLFFSIVDAINPRKNLETLLWAFSRVHEQYGSRVRLILKQYRALMDIGNIPGVQSIAEPLSELEIAALHLACNAYVSAHHSEGWGLGLSEAMAYGKPVVATGWSGNMEFMDQENSFPVPYTLVPVSDEMCRRLPLFQPHMFWADIDKNALVLFMKRAVEGRYDPDLPRLAARVAQRFSVKAVAAVMKPLLEARSA